MATRPQNDQTNVIELDAFRGDRAQLEVQEVVHNRTTEITAGEHYAAQAIRASYGVEPDSPEVHETPRMQTIEGGAETTSRVEGHLQVVSEALTPSTQQESITSSESDNSANENNARASVAQIYAESGEPQIKLPEAA